MFLYRTIILWSLLISSCRTCDKWRIELKSEKSLLTDIKNLFRRSRGDTWKLSITGFSGRNVTLSIPLQEEHIWRLLENGQDRWAYPSKHMETKIQDSFESLLNKGMATTHDYVGQIEHSKKSLYFNWERMQIVGNEFVNKTFRFDVRRNTILKRIHGPLDDPRAQRVVDLLELPENYDFKSNWKFRILEKHTSFRQLVSPKFPSLLSPFELSIEEFKSARFGDMVFGQKESVRETVYFSCHVLTDSMKSSLLQIAVERLLLAWYLQKESILLSNLNSRRLKKLESATPSFNAAHRDVSSLFFGDMVFGQKESVRETVYFSCHVLTDSMKSSLLQIAVERLLLAWYLQKESILLSNLNSRRLKKLESEAPSFKAAHRDVSSLFFGNGIRDRIGSFMVTRNFTPPYYWVFSGTSMSPVVEFQTKCTGFMLSVLYARKVPPSGTHKGENFNLGKQLAVITAKQSKALGYNEIFPTELARRTFLMDFIHAYGVDMHYFERSNFRHYESVNDWLTRRYGEENLRTYRPMSYDSRMLACPADSRALVFENFSPARSNDHVWVKDQNFTLRTFLGKYKDAKRFRGGVFFNFRLTLSDYHCFHSPATGKVIWDSGIIGETLFAADPLAMRAGVGALYNKRRVLIIDAENMGHIAYVIIGSTMIGSIELLDGDGGVLSDVVGKLYQKGEIIGCFKFGGSTVSMLLEPGKFAVNPELSAMVMHGVETWMDVRSSIAILKTDSPDYVQPASITYIGCFFGSLLLFSIIVCAWLSSRCRYVLTFGQLPARYYKDDISVRVGRASLEQRNAASEDISSEHIMIGNLEE
eukprot:79251_1